MMRVKLKIEILIFVILFSVYSFQTFAKSDVYWPKELYKDGGPDITDGDLEDKLGDSGYYYDIFPNEKSIDEMTNEELEKYYNEHPNERPSSQSSGKKTDYSHPITVYKNVVKSWYDKGNSSLNNNSVQNNLNINNTKNQNQFQNKKDIGFVAINNNIYYLKSDGSFRSQWIKEGNNWYYFDKDTYIMLHNENRNINNRLYHFDDNGIMATNRDITINGVLYHINEKGECNLLK